MIPGLPIRLPGAARSPIGLDIGSARVNAVQLRRTASGGAIAASASIERRGGGLFDESEARRVRAILARRGFTGSRVVVAIPDALTFSAVVESPPAESGAPIEQIIRAELARLSSLAPTSFELARWVLPEPERRGKAERSLSIAVESEPLRAMIAALETAGLDPIAADLPMLGLWRAGCMIHPKPGRDTVLVDAGASAARVGVVRRDELIYVRTVTDAALRPRVERVAKALGLEVQQAESLLWSPSTESASSASPHERIVPELAACVADAVGTCVAYAAHMYRDLDPVCVVVGGGGAALPGLVEALAGQLQVECVSAAVPAQDSASLPASSAVACAMASWPESWEVWAPRSREAA